MFSTLNLRLFATFPCVLHSLRPSLNRPRLQKVLRSFQTIHLVSLQRDLQGPSEGRLVKCQNGRTALSFDWRMKTQKRGVIDISAAPVRPEVEISFPKVWSGFVHFKQTVTEWAGFLSSRAAVNGCKAAILPPLSLKGQTVSEKRRQVTQGRWGRHVGAWFHFVEQSGVSRAEVYVCRMIQRWRISSSIEKTFFYFTKMRKP